MNQNDKPQTPVKRALVVIRELRLELDAVKKARSEPIAVVGMGFRFPRAIHTPEDLWALLSQGETSISEVPPQRWNMESFYDPTPGKAGKICTRLGGFLEGVDRFDPHFFGITPREAAWMDPQQRLLLEVAWETLAHACIAPDDLYQSPAGVFIGISGFDYASMMMSSQCLSQMDSRAGTGGALSAAAGRLAYNLGLTGPAMAVDTACSSSLTAIHLARESLLSGGCNLALAGGVNLLLRPEPSVLFSHAQMLSPDGRCKTFDAAANGYVRGEGCGLLVLQRLSDAIADKRRILALIRGSAVNQDGASGGFTVPSGPAQESVIRAALLSAGLHPHQVGYIEAHGTGTALGDPIEVNALNRVFGKDRSKDNALPIGTIKTNIGHLEGAAGIAGLIKAILTLEHGQIPPHPQLERLNPNIDWAGFPITVPVRLQPWPATSTSRFAGVSSFGFSGTNAHVIVEEAPLDLGEKDAVEPPRHILALSAKTEEALEQLCEQYQRFFSTTEKRANDICTSANTGRNHLKYRVFATGSTVSELARNLTQRRGQTHTDPPVRIQKPAFLFSGQGSQYAHMGSVFYQTQPVFKQYMDQSAQILNDHLQIPLLEVIYPRTEEKAALIHQTVYTQPAIFALEYALARLWHHWGFEPNSYFGHSIGEYTAACLAGVFSLEDALTLVAARGRLMQSLPQTGEMVAITASRLQVIPYMDDYGKELSIAAVNGPDRIVLSGSCPAVRDVVERLAERGFGAQHLKTSHAFHSPLMKPILVEFEAVARRITWSVPQKKIFSNRDGLPAGEAMARPEYWCDHITGTVEFFRGMSNLMEDGGNTILELGPQPVLSSLARKFAPAQTLFLPTFRPDGRDWYHHLESLGRLYRRGQSIDWKALYKNGRKITVPGYPFQRQRYWATTNSEPAHAGEVGGNPVIIPPHGFRLRLPFTDEIRFERRLQPHAPAHLADHILFDLVVVPAATHLALLLRAAGEVHQSRQVHLGNLIFSNALVLEEKLPRPYQLIFRADGPDRHQLRFASLKPQTPESETQSWEVHGTGRLNDPKELRAPDLLDIQAVKTSCPNRLERNAFYARFGEIGYRPGPSFQWLQEAFFGVEEALGFFTVPPLPEPEQNYFLFPGLIDTCFQLAAFCFQQQNDQPLDQGTIFVPFSLGELYLYQQPHGRKLLCHIRLKHDGKRTRAAIHLFEETGEPVAAFQDFEVRKISAHALAASQTQARHQSLYEVAWQSLPAGGETQTPNPKEPWLVFSDDLGLGTLLQERLRGMGLACLSLKPQPLGDPFENGGHVLDPVELEDLFKDESAGKRNLVFLYGHAEPDKDSVYADLAGLLQLLQTMARQGVMAQTRLWLVTEGAARPGFFTPNTAGATAIWGMSRVIAMEHSELELRVIDLKPDEPEPAARLTAELFRSRSELQIALDGNQRLAPRLVPFKTTALEHGLNPKPDKTYLITGGLGGLGLVFANRLVELGCRYLVLTGRRGTPSPDSEKVLQNLKKIGAEVLVLAADVADETHMVRVMNRIHSDLPPLAGVIHAAGVLKDAGLRSQDWSHFRQVLEPKVSGGRILNELTSGLELDFFICFSSMATLLGSPGQAAYAAANGYLDGLCQYRRSLGLPALSIHWGPWSEVGMTARMDPSNRDRMRAAGISFIDRETGTKALDQLLDGDHAAGAVFQVDWHRFLARFPKMPPLLQTLAARPASHRQGIRQTALLRQLKAAAPKKADSLLTAYIRKDLAETLGFPSVRRVDPSRGFFEMGMDSLMAIEFKDRLQIGLDVELPSTLAFDYGSVEALTAFLVSEMGLATTPDTAATPSADLLAAVSAMSEAEAERRLLEKIDQLL